MGGMLLTYYRSKHPRGASHLQVAEGVPVEQGGQVVDVDIAIVDRKRRQVVAFYQLLAPLQNAADVGDALERLRAHLDDHMTPDYQVELGVVLPESREGELPAMKRVAGADLQLVTYPA